MKGRSKSKVRLAKKLLNTSTKLLKSSKRS